MAARGLPSRPLRSPQGTATPQPRLHASTPTETGATSASDPNSGEGLLKRLSSLPKPLTDDQVAHITRHLDSFATTESCRTPDGRTFISKDLRIGTRRTLNEEESTSQNSADSSTRMPPTERFDLQTQRDAFEFVRSDARIEIELKHSRAWIQIGGMHRKVFHYQLYAAFLMLKEERGPRRGIVEGDRMGLGKVSICQSWSMGKNSDTEL